MLKSRIEKYKRTIVVMHIFTTVPNDANCIVGHNDCYCYCKDLHDVIDEVLLQYRGSSKRKIFFWNHGVHKTLKVPTTFIRTFSPHKVMKGNVNSLANSNLYELKSRPSILN